MCVRVRCPLLWFVCPRHRPSPSDRFGPGETLRLREEGNAELSRVLLAARQPEHGADEVKQAVVRHLQADVGAVQGRRSLQVSDVVEVSAYQGDHLPAAGETRRKRLNAVTEQR